jgi:uncharacterized coiled-coil DUF342 family protein
MMGRGHGEGALERGTAEMTRLVEETVKDPGKAKQVQAILQDISTEVKKSSQQTRGYHEQLYTLNADYQAKPEQFTKVLDELNNARMASATKILGMRFKIKDLLTAQEWKDLTDEMAKSRSRYAPKAEGMQGGAR